MATLSACSGGSDGPPPLAGTTATPVGEDGGAVEVGTAVEAGTSGACVAAACSPNATCAEDAGVAVCVCQEGYTGDGVNCTKVFHCNPNPCLNGGVCIDGTSSASCSCSNGFSGPTCGVLPPHCAAIKLAKPTSFSGVYSISPDRSTKSFEVYCDMVTDGGGWTKILHTASTAYTPTSGSAGTIASISTSSFAKLSDARIRAIATALGENVVYRIKGPTSPTGKKLFVATTAPFTDTALGMGLISKLPLKACEVADFASCAFSTVTIANTIDSFAWKLALNDQDRYFTDYVGFSPAVGCYSTATAGVRCFSTGISADHALIPYVTIWVR